MPYAHTEEFEGFDIALEMLPEDFPPDWDFESPEDEAETLRRIDCGVYLWFIAKVTASKSGVVLATDYLGGCCYESVAEFIQPGGYYGDMRAAVCSFARAKIQELTSV